MEKQMIELKYNESSQLRVRLAILESQLKMANNKFENMKKNKIKIKVQVPNNFKFSKKAFSVRPCLYLDARQKTCIGNTKLTNSLLQS